MPVKKNKAVAKTEPIGLRVTIPVGKTSTSLINQIAARFRKETGSEWTQADVVAAASGLGLRSFCERFKLEHQSLLALKD